MLFDVWVVNSVTGVQILTLLHPLDGLNVSCMQMKVEAGTIDPPNIQLPLFLLV